MSTSRDSQTRFADALHYTGLAAVCLWFTLMSVRAIANVWQWGHNGYNGAAFWNAARNSLRFGIVGQALYHFELAAPSPTAVYTHHPLLLHAHLVLSQWILGTAEWAARLVPAFYSALTLPVLYLVARALWDRGVALAACAVYATLPLPLIFANMVDHEQATIVWLLVFLFAVVRFVEEHRRRWVWLALVSFTLAAQWDWAAYYVAAFVFVLVVARAVWRREPWRSHPYRFAAIFSVVVLANFVGFFAWIAWMRGDVANMQNALSHRTSDVPGYWPVVAARSLDLFGPLPLVAFAVWLVWLVRRRPSLRDLVPLAFAGAQLMHSVIFKQAGFLHSYWVWYASPALAIGTAEVALTVVRGAPARLARWAWVLPVIGLLWQAGFAWRQWAWGFETGSASYAFGPNDDDHVEELRWARELARAFPRERTRFLAHSSLQRRRIEMDWYLDAPVVPTAGLSIPVGTADRRDVLLVDLHHLSMTAPVRAQLAALRRGEVRVWERRFVAVSGGPTVLTAWRTREEPASVAWRWFVNPKRPPVEWVQDDASVVEGIFAPRGDVTTTESRGGRGGAERSWLCPHGQWLTEIGGRSSSSPTVLAGIQARCAGRGEATSGPWLGERPATVEVSSRCPDGTRPAGVRVRSGALVDALGLACRSSEGIVFAPLVGGPHGRDSALDCPQGAGLVGLSIRSGARVDAVAAVCAPLAPIQEASHTAAP